MDLPEDSEGLQWIVSQGASQLLLIPGLHAISIAAAAAGDQAALAYLRFTAQHFTAFAGTQRLTRLDKLCLAHSDFSEWRGLYEAEAEQLDEDQALFQVFTSREAYTQEMLLKAIAEGRLAALIWLRALCHQAIDIAGHVDIGLTTAAARQGSLAMLKHLRSGPHPAPWSVSVLTAALPHLDCLKWMLEQDPPCPCTASFIAGIASKGDLGLLQWLHQHSCVPLTCWTDAVACAAAASGDLAVLDWLHAQKLPAVWGPTVCMTAAAGGHISVLQWLRAEGHKASWDASTTTAAAEHCQLATLQWLRAQQPPAPWDEKCCVAAANRNDLAMLQWLHAQQPPAPWDERCTTAAAARNNLSMLQWLRACEPPCPWNDCCTRAAAAQADTTVLQWMRCQSPPCPWTDECTCRAAARGDLSMLQCLWALSPPCPFHSRCTMLAAGRGDLPMLQWLASHGCPLSRDLYYHVAGAYVPAYHILRWLRDQKVPAPETVSDRLWMSCCLFHVKPPTLMLLADLGAGLPKAAQANLILARKSFCTFHGLVRWIRRAVSDPSKNIHLAFNQLTTDVSGQQLLLHLSMLAPELVCKIAVMARLQYDVSD